MQAVVGRRALEKQAASTNTLSRFETEILVTEENLRRLRQPNAAWIDRAMVRTCHQRIILNMDSSESPVFRELGIWRSGGSRLQRPLRLCLLSPPVLLQPVWGLRGGNAEAGECA